MGRSTGEAILLINELVVYGVTLVILRQNLRVSKTLQGITSKVMGTLLALLAEIERDFISLRTKEALAAKKAQGLMVGKPKGTIQSSVYDKDRQRIEELLSLGVPRNALS